MKTDRIDYVSEKTIPQIIEEVRELTELNDHSKARELLAKLAGHRNEEALRYVKELHFELGYAPLSLLNLRRELFEPVIEKLEICYPDYIEEIRRAL